MLPHWTVPRETSCVPFSCSFPASCPEAESLSTLRHFTHLTERVWVSVSGLGKEPSAQEATFAGQADLVDFARRVGNSGGGRAEPAAESPATNAYPNAPSCPKTMGVYVLFKTMGVYVLFSMFCLAP
jgi:hypothetical protein